VGNTSNYNGHVPVVLECLGAREGSGVVWSAWSRLSCLALDRSDRVLKAQLRASCHVRPKKNGTPGLDVVRWAGLARRPLELLKGRPDASARPAPGGTFLVRTRQVQGAGSHCAAESFRGGSVREQVELTEVNDAEDSIQVCAASPTEW
jgi:hypothetical protein